MGQSAEIGWMNQQLIHVLTQTEGDPFQTVKNMAEEVEYCGAGAWIKLLRAYRGKNEGRSQRLTKRCARHQKQSDGVYGGFSLARTCGKLSWKSTSRIPTEKWRTWPLQTVEETSFPTKCPRSLWSCPTSFCTLRSTRTSSIRLACACVQSRDVKRLVQTESNPWIRALHTGDEFVEPHEDDEIDLNALMVKGKGSEDNCFFFHCGQYGHRVAEWWKRDTWWGARERAWGLPGSIHHSNNCAIRKRQVRLWKCGDVEGSLDQRLGRSGVHSVEDPYTWQRGTGDGVLFGLEMTRSNLRRQWSARTLDHERKSIDSWSVYSQASDSEARDEGQCRETSTQCIRNHAPILRCETSSRNVILGVDWEMDSNWHQSNCDGEPLTNEDKAARFQTRVTKKRSPRSRYNWLTPSDQLQLQEHGLWSRWVCGASLNVVTLPTAGVPNRGRRNVRKTMVNAKCAVWGRVSCGHDIPSGWVHQAVELGVNIVRRRERGHIHCPGRHY